MYNIKQSRIRYVIRIYIACLAIKHPKWPLASPCFRLVMFVGTFIPFEDRLQTYKRQILKSIPALKELKYIDIQMKRKELSRTFRITSN